MACALVLHDRLPHLEFGFLLNEPRAAGWSMRSIIAAICVCHPGFDLYSGRSSGPDTYLKSHWPPDVQVRMYVPDFVHIS
jgi:hypothetical protein